MKRILVVATIAALLATLCVGTMPVAAESKYTTGAEVLVNGDFEQDTLRWAADDNSPGKQWIKAGVGKDGGVGMRLSEVVADENNEKVQFYQGLIEVTPGNRYVLTFDYLANPGNTFYVRSGSLGCGQNTVKLGDDADGTWKTYTTVFVVPTTYTPKENKGLGVYITKVGDEPAVIDNLSLKECSLNAKPESVVLDYDEITLIKGRTQTLKALVNPVKSDMNNTAWTSSDEAVATVSMGKVTAVGGGTATITVAMNNGKSASCKVTVVDKEVTAADLTVESLTWTGGGEVDPGTELTLTATVTNVGTDDVTEPFDVDFSAGTKLIARVTYNKGIKAGETVAVTTEPWKAVAGDHMMAATVNTTRKVAESNDVTNNAYQINLRVAEDRLVPAYNADLVTEAGFTNLTFNDDFDSLDTVDKAASGKAGYKWYVTRPYGASTLTPDDYSVKDGILSLHLEVSTYNYGLSTVDIPTWNGYTFHKGYMEFRIRMPHYDGDLSGGPAIWSMPENKLHNKDVEMWIEVDWMEYWGVTKGKPDGFYTITLHEQWVDETITVTDWYSNGGNRSKSGFGDAEWHTMGFLWEENSLRAFFDGKQVLEQTYGGDGVPIPLPTTEQGEFRIDDVFSYMNEQILPVFISGSKGNPMEIDYIRVWQAGDAEAEDSPETGAASALPTVGAVLTAAAAGMWVSRKRK